MDKLQRKKPKVVYHHFGSLSWEPKVEKGDNYVATTYGPVGYEVTYSHDGEETTSGKKPESEDNHKGNENLWLKLH